MSIEELKELIDLIEETNQIESHKELYEHICLIYEYRNAQEETRKIEQKLYELSNKNNQE